MRKKTVSKKLLDNDLVWVVIIFVATMTLYVLLVQVWKITSPTYPPADAFDHVVRLPENKSEWLIRRAHGVCPFDAMNFEIKDPFAGFKDC